MKDFLLITIVVIGMIVALSLALWLWTIGELNEDTWIIVLAVFMSGFVLAALAMPRLREQQRKMQEKRNRHHDKSIQVWSEPRPGGHGGADGSG